MTQNWEVNINFKVSGKGKELFGDGFAIWYARDRLIEGPVFGSKDHFHGLAIILDTYSNHNGPHNVSKNIRLFCLQKNRFFLIKLYDTMRIFFIHSINIRSSVR